MPVVEGGLAVIRRTAFYRDLDSGKKDLLYAKDVVRVVFRKGSSWVVESGPGINALQVPQKDLVAFKDPVAAKGRYSPGDTYGVKRNPKRKK